MDNNFWNDRYGKNEYYYGVDPNSFLVEHVDVLEGPVLSLSEGEGRNAVYLALRGLKVHGVDFSDTALSKAQALAKSQSVEIQTEVADLATFEPKENFYGSVISISAHLPCAIRNRLYPLIEKSLKPGGTIVLEAYTADQLLKDTGGPRNVDMLMSEKKLKNEFPNFEPILLREIEREVIEGDGHTGLASVVQFVARKNA